jgi:hypothetical protein
MMFHLPWWFIVAYFIVYCWFITIPAIIILVVVGSSANVARGWRATAFVAAVLLALPLLVYGRDIITEWGETNGWIQADRRVLDRDETVLGLALPAGSRVRFEDRSQKKLTWIQLPHSARIQGMGMVGDLEWSHFAGEHWEGQLAWDQTLNGWPCRAGVVTFTPDWTVQQCVLAQEHQALGVTWPAGTKIFRRDSEPLWALELPSDAGIAIPTFSMTVPPRAGAFMSGKGRLNSLMWASNDQPITVHDVPLSSLDRDPDGDLSVATLYSPFMVAGEVRPTGTKICIDLVTGKVSLVGKSK